MLEYVEVSSFPKFPLICYILSLSLLASGHGTVEKDLSALELKSSNSQSLLEHTKMRKRCLKWLLVNFVSHYSGTSEELLNLMLVSCTYLVEYCGIQCWTSLRGRPRPRRENLRKGQDELRQQNIKNFSNSSF